jgi:YbbR domain-containing protein
VKRIRKLLLENILWKLLSLLVAVILWALVASEPELSTFATAPLQFKDLPDDLEINSQPVTAVSLELRGPSGALRGVSDGALHPSVVLDMSTVAPGQRTFAIGSGNVKLMRGVRLVRAIPSEVRFTFEHRLEREVPVEVRFTGDGAEGYTVAHYTAEPAKVEIAGPASRVANVAAVVTDPVDVAKTTASQEFRVNAFVNDSFVRIVSSPQVRVVVTMKKK